MSLRASDNNQMITGITLSQILLIFFLPSSAVDAQSSSPHYHDPSFDPVVVPLIGVFLFVACCSIFLHRCSNMGLAAAGRQTGAAANCSSGDSQSIDAELLNKFPIFVYSAVKHLKFGKDANECAVCLSEFDQQDNLRLLPKCNHVFHSQCIDAWLASHVTCPVCRSTLKPAEEHGGGDNEVVIVIPNEVINAHLVFGGSSESRTEPNSGDLRSLGRSHSTGHSLGFGQIEGKDREMYTIRILEDVLKKQVKNKDGGMRRSASYDVLHGQLG